MSKSNYKNLATELKKHIDILENTFSRNNLQILNFNLKPYSEDDGDIIILLELATLEGIRVPHSLSIKVNLYDNDDEIIGVYTQFINSTLFEGYDTLEITCSENSSLLDNAVKGRLYATAN